MEINKYNKSNIDTSFKKSNTDSKNYEFKKIDYKSSIKDEDSYIKNKYIGDINVISFDEDLVNAKNITSELAEIAKSDTQINTSNDIEKYSDFQNIMLSNLSFLELYYDNPNMLSGKTIRELFEETYDGSYTEQDYLDFVFDTQLLVDLTDDEVKKKNLNLFLGKLMLYGFGDLKVSEMVRGKNGFDAVVVQDENENYLVYYSCTDIYESEDLLYDSYPIFEKNGMNITVSLTQQKKIYDSQREQAVELLEKYSNKGKIVNVGGFSLGGSLAEYAYGEVYKEQRNSMFQKQSSLGNLILFNPYHLTVLPNSIIESDKYKLYASEGDFASTIFNYDTYSDYTHPVYIDYNNVIESDKKIAFSNCNFLAQIGTNFKNVFMDSIIDSCNSTINFIDANWYLWLSPALGISALTIRTALKSVINIAKELKKYSVNSKEFFEKFAELQKKVQSIIDVLPNGAGEKIDIEFLKGFQTLEVILSGIHMPYSVEINRDISFDEHGMVKKYVNDKKVTYPTAAEISNIVFGCDIYEELSEFFYAINFLRLK